jgi:Protein of unknown function (DUF3987)
MVRRRRLSSSGPPARSWAPIQPERLRQFWNSTNDGMLARLIFIWPRLAAAKPVDFDGDPRARGDLIHTLRRAYQALFGLKLDSQDGERLPKQLALAAGARASFNEAYLRCEEKARRGHGAFAEWLGKGPGRILRLALVFELMAWALEPTAAEPEEISVDAVARAIRYFTYLETMFLRAMVGIEPIETGGDALAVARLVVERQWSHFAPNDVGREPGFRWFRGERRGDKERRDNALRALADTNAIRREGQN